MLLGRSGPTPPAPLDVPENRVFITCFHCVAILFTIFRLTRRTRIHRLSWDDGWAAFAALMIVGFLVVDWVKWGTGE
ncbi:hypothetical protein AAF712_007734 [Marasmius tenuissimus]|uniref:Uncharacterized protein n=1 Tax=Marasmius tenuissimus TaxID=585030 RepID=A0ABR2ZWQ6_9AGAR